MQINRNRKKYLDNYRIFSYTFLTIKETSLIAGLAIMIMMFSDRLPPRNHAIFQILYRILYTDVFNQPTRDAQKIKSVNYR